MQPSTTPDRRRLAELARLFGLLGVIGFGGPAAHIALVHREVVERRRWMDEQRFLDLVGVTNLLPGPNSTELVMHIGLDRGGRRGLVVAGLAFILPAALIVGVLAALYVAFGTTPLGEGLLYGVKPVAIAIVLAAVVRLGSVALAGPLRAVIGVGVVVLAVAGVHELALLAGGAGTLAIARATPRLRARWLSQALLPASAAGLALGAVAQPVSIGLLFATLLKIGAVLYGSGYVLIALLRADFVERLGWLTDQQLLDAAAVGQVTPGPLFTTATFVGYLVAGPIGAVVGTVAIFLPAFLFVALLGGLAARLRRRPLAAAMLDGVNAAAIGLMAAVSLPLAASAVVDPLTAGLGVLAAVLVLRGAPSVWLIVLGMFVGSARLWLGA